MQFSLANWLFSSPKRISLVVLACIVVGGVVQGATP
jgi:hypothetical protein